MGWPGVVVPPEAEERGRAARCRERLLPGVPDRGRAGGVLRPDLQRDALAALPLLRRPHALHARGLGRLRRGQRALRRDDRRASARRGPGSGFTTSTSRSFRVSCGALRPDLAIGFFLHIPFPSSEIYRLLPTQDRAPARDAGRRLHRVPHRRLCPSLPLLMPAGARDRVRPRHDRLRRPHDRDRRAPDRDRRRELPRRACATRRRRRSRPSSTSATTASSSCSASSGSTTRRGSRRSSTRSSASSSRIPSAPTA